MGLSEGSLFVRLGPDFCRLASRETLLTRGAGKSEWRSAEGIPPEHLEYRRNLGNASQKTWRKASVYPLGV